MIETATGTTSPATQPACPACNGVGWVETPQDGMARCACKLSPKAVLASRGVPARFLSSSFQTFQPGGGNTAEALAECQQFVERFEPSGRGLLLSGPSGTGKTHLAVATLRALRSAHVLRGRFVRAARLIQELKDAIEAEGVRVGDMLDRVVGADVLVLDDLGAIRETDWAVEQLVYVLTQRYDEMRATIVTTNLNQRDRARHVGERVAGRLSETCQEVVFATPDYRTLGQAGVKEAS